MTLTGVLCFTSLKFLCSDIFSGAVFLLYPHIQHHAYSYCCVLMTSNSWSEHSK